MDEMVLNIIQPLGALPIRFGSSQSQVHELLGRKPDVEQKAYLTRFIEEFYYYPFLKLTFSIDKGLYFIEVVPDEGVHIYLNEEPIFIEGKYRNDLIPFLQLMDPNPQEKVGILTFPKLGVSIPQDLDDDDGSFCIFSIEMETNQLESTKSANSR